MSSEVKPLTENAVMGLLLSAELNIRLLMNKCDNLEAERDQATRELSLVTQELAVMEQARDQALFQRDSALMEVRGR